MSEKNEAQRIVTTWTRDSWLHAQDSLWIGKLMFWAGDKKGGKHARAYVSISGKPDCFRPVCHDLYLRGHLPKAFYELDSRSNDERYKYEVMGGSKGESIISRILTITDTPSNNKPIALTVSEGPGREHGNGLIAPKSGKSMERWTFYFTRYEARAFFGQVHARIRYWESLGSPNDEWESIPSYPPKRREERQQPQQQQPQQQQPQLDHLKKPASQAGANNRGWHAFEKAVQQGKVDLQGIEGKVAHPMFWAKYNYDPEALVEHDDHQRKHFHAIGSEIFKDWDSVRPTVVSDITFGQYESSRHLTAAQMQSAINQMKKLRERKKAA